MFAASGQRLKVDGLQRVVRAEETFARAKDAARALGVTRLADITGLDRIGIPTYAAIVPKSDDVISTYTGKGLRPIDAQVGALMEAIERQTILNSRLPYIEDSYARLKKDHRVINPQSLNERLRSEYSERNIYCWVAGTDLISKEEVMVPADFAGYLWKEIPHGGCFECSSSNGMASGNCTEEAICHALCELIERDAWTLIELSARALPWARRRLAYGYSAEGDDDFDAAPCLDLGDEPALQAFEKAGLFPVVRDITTDIGVPVVFAAVPDDMVPGFPMVHCGLGAHPNAAVAARRALTEAAQSRCVDIQGVREDLAPPDSPISDLTIHTRRVSRVDRQAWHLGQSKLRRHISRLESHDFADIRDDLDFLLQRLMAVGINEIIAVQFPSPCDSLHVVRVIVPELESWAISHGKLGRRALHFWQETCLAS